ncbi:2'-5' RNA ligase family protein [Streptomyces sp. NPDC060194]|uniref:2'-5' RNA ligase family protein n=1 Tax=Streptomyces sp. NPDC060194 TaxID=3347069 RepID=UPI00364A052D
MRTVELLLDEHTEQRVVDAWHRLAAAGLPSQSNHSHPTNRPHLTFASADAWTPSAFAAVRAELHGLDLPAAFDGLLRFAGRYDVLALRVRPDARLLRLHRTVHGILRDAGVEAGNPHLQPGSWQPHITLGRARGATWDLPDDLLLPPALRGPAAPAGRFAAARTYDSASRTTAGL